MLRAYAILVTSCVMLLGTGVEAQFIRKTQNLETAIVTYRLPAGQTISLLAAVHVAEKDFYSTLQARMQTYARVLFELVTDAPIERLPAGYKTKGGSSLGGAQRMMAETLGLSYQLDEIDYSRPNMLRADMTSSELAFAMKERDETLLKLYLKAASMQRDPKANLGVAELVMLLLPKSRAFQARRLLAEEFADMSELLKAFGGSDSSALLAARNNVALQTLQERLQAGDTSIGIFYGAAHMQDFEEKLVKDFGATTLKEEWVVAWKLH